MMPKARLPLALGAFAAFALLGILLYSRLGSPFARYIDWPMASSVREFGFKSNGFRILFEPVVFIAFTASPSDLGALIRKKGFKTAEAEMREWVGQRDAPLWWKPGPLQADEMLFTKATSRGRQFIRIDASGTNAYFLLWGI
jgi:hypothetical protein